MGMMAMSDKVCPFDKRPCQRPRCAVCPHLTDEKMVKAANDVTKAMADLVVKYKSEPGVIGAALANITAMWVAAHFVPNDPEATESERNRVLAMHHRAVVAGVMFYAERDEEMNLLIAEPGGRA